MGCNAKKERGIMKMGDFWEKNLFYGNQSKNSIYEKNICEVLKKVTQRNNFGVAAIMSLSSVCVCMQWIFGHS